jgi:hypothetical protein
MCTYDNRCAFAASVAVVDASNKTLAASLPPSVLTLRLLGNASGDET